MTSRETFPLILSVNMSERLGLHLLGQNDPGVDMREPIIHLSFIIKREVSDDLTAFCQTGPITSAVTA